MYFITGNQNKLTEVQAVLPLVKAWKVDLPEIQHFSAEQVIQSKLSSAAALSDAPEAFFIEDTSLYIDCLKGLPGPLIKWFISEQTLGLSGLSDLVSRYENKQAQAKTIFGLHHQGQAQFFEGSIPGKIISPRGSQGFGWDAIFQPHGSELSLAEMDLTTKNNHSMRRLALDKMKKELISQGVLLT